MRYLSRKQLQEIFYFVFKINFKKNAFPSRLYSNTSSMVISFTLNYPSLSCSRVFNYCLHYSREWFPILFVNYRKLIFYHCWNHQQICKECSHNIKYLFNLLEISSNMVFRDISRLYRAKMLVYPQNVTRILLLSVRFKTTVFQWVWCAAKWSYRYRIFSKVEKVQIIIFIS